MAETHPLAQASALDAGRPKHEFTIPESARTLATDPKQVCLRQLTIAEEMRAVNASQALKTSAAYELIKAAIVEADGKPVTWDAGGKESFLEGCSPKVRQLLISAFERVNTPQAKEVEDFLASATVRIG